MPEVKESPQLENEHIVFEKEKAQSKTADSFELLKMTLDQLHTIETSISVTEKLFEEIRHRQEEFPEVAETLVGIEKVLGVTLSDETKMRIEQGAEESSLRSVDLLLGRMHARKEYLEKRRAELEAGNTTKESKEAEKDASVMIDADFDTLAEHEKIKHLPWKTVYEDGGYRIKTATVSIPEEKKFELGMREVHKEVHLVLIENTSNIKDDVVLALEKQPRADMLSIPEVFEELEKMGTSKKRNVVEIDADRRKFYEDLIRADLLSASIVEGSNGSLRLTIREQAVPWSFLPPDEFITMGKMNARKYDGSMDAIKDIHGKSVPKEVFLDEETLKAYVKGGDAWEEHHRAHGGRTYTTKSGEQASQDKG